MLAPNFTAGEFLRHNRVTTLGTVRSFQSFRDDIAKRPVKITRVVREGDLLTTKGETSQGITFEAQSSISKDFPIYGCKAGFPHKVLQKLYNGNGMSEFNTADKLLIAALCQNGFQEGPDNSTPFGKDMGLNNTSWCAVFFHWCLQKARAMDFRGVSVPVSFTPELSNSRRTFELAPITETDPALFKPGSAVVWKRKGSSIAGHTAILLSNDTEKEELWFIEGNMSDKVRIIKREYSALTYGKLQLYGAAQYLPEPASDCFTDFTMEAPVKNETYT